MKPFWIVLLTILVAGGIVGGGTYYYLNDKAEKDKSSLNSQIDALQAQQNSLQKQLADLQTSKTTEATDLTADWLTYTDTANKFSFKYPKDFNLMNERGTTSTTKPNVGLSSGDINTTADADGACGSASSALYKAQSAAFANAKIGESFDKAWSETELKTSLSTIISNASNIKFARCFQLCQGIVEDSDPVGYKLQALTFKGNNRYEIRVDVPAEIANVLAKDQSAQATLINQGKGTGIAQTAFDNFKLIIDSYRFL